MENEAYTCGVAFVYILFFHTELNLNVNCILNTYECLFLCHRLLFTKNKHGENKMINLKRISIPMSVILLNIGQAYSMPFQ